MDYSRIPEELKNQNQWVCAWDGSKVPMRAFERKAASSTAPDTWSTFEQAEWAVENGHYDHIGYVFADQNIVGIDIDAGFEDGLMTPLCADIMQACHSYTEKSRSGRGVHILMRGKLPFSGKNNLAGVEIYQARRFFIMTGKVLIFPEIIDNQEAIDYVVEKYFKETEKTGNNSSMVQRIYSPKFPKPAAESLSDRTTRKSRTVAETFLSPVWQVHYITPGTLRCRFIKNCRESMTKCVSHLFQTENYRSLQKV